MAAGDRTSIHRDSDIFYEFSCSLCEKKDRNVEAIKRCDDCGVNLCGDCLVNHNLFPAMQDHSLVDKQDVGKSLAQDGGRPDLPRVKCDKHPGNRVELYCGRHDDVGCATCGNTDHKLCKDMHYVPDVAAGIKATSEPRDVADSLVTLVNRTALVKQAREEDLKRVTTQMDTAVENIEERVEAIKQRLDELKVAAIAEVNETFGEIEQAITGDVDSAGDLIKKLEKEEKRLKAAQNMGESDLFVHAKQGRAGIKEGEKVVQELEKSRENSLHFAIDDTVLACVTGLETFVKVDRSVELALSVEQCPSVRMKNDKKECSITDCCFLNNGNMLLSDVKNECVKLVDKSFKALDRCPMQDPPIAVCTVGTNEVAIALWEKKVVNFATVDDKIRLTRFFRVGEHCRGISFSNNRLFISCGGAGGEGPGQVRIYNTSGTLLQTIKHDSLKVPYHNMATRNDGCIVANETHGILAFDNAGKNTWQCRHADLKDAVGLCEVEDRLLVCCWKNGHVFQVNPADQSSNILLQGSTELKPRSLIYDTCNDKLVITKSYGDRILVYKVSRK